MEKFSCSFCGKPLPDTGHSKLIKARGAFSENYVCIGCAVANKMTIVELVNCEGMEKEVS